MFCIQSQQTQSDWYRPTVFCWTGCVLQPPFNDSNHDDDNSWFSLSRSHHPSPNRGLIRNRLLCLWQWTMMSEFFLWQMSRHCEPSFMDLSVYLDGYSPEMVHCDNGLWIECPRSWISVFPKWRVMMLRNKSVWGTGTKAQSTLSKGWKLEIFLVVGHMYSDGQSLRTFFRKFFQKILPT